jgi:murein DD-endopeptidase MepM/ murein hydrolase activator NlpD
MLRPLFVLAVVLGVIATALPPVAPPVVRASHTAIKMPFPAGADWYISQGYNTSPAEGWTHYNCDPRTGRDEISGTERCEPGWQYKYSFDLRRSDGQEAGQPVLSPVDGVVRWIDEYHGGMSIDLGDGYAVAFYHADLARGVAAGQAVRQGQQLGTVAGPGGGANGGTPHIHLTLWRTEDGGNWSRIAVPFTDEHALDGYDFPALGDRVRNQHFNAVVVSSNQGGQAAPSEPGRDRPRRDGRGGPEAAAPAASPEAAPTTPPTTPMPASPASGTVFAADQAPILAWEPVPGALEYQVVLNEGERTGPWLAETSWTAGTLPTGEYRWQVRARNWAGESALWEPWTFTVAAPTAAPSSFQAAAAPPTRSAAAPDAAATPAATPAATTPVAAQATATEEVAQTAEADAAASPSPGASPASQAVPTGPAAGAAPAGSPDEAASASPAARAESAPMVAPTAEPTAEPTEATIGGDELSPREQQIAANAFEKANELRERQGLAPMEIPVAIAPAVDADEDDDSAPSRRADAAQEAPPVEGGKTDRQRRRDAVVDPTAEAPTAGVSTPTPTEPPPVVDDQAGEDGVARSSNEPGEGRERPDSDSTPAPEPTGTAAATAEVVAPSETEATADPIVAAAPDATTDPNAIGSSAAPVESMPTPTATSEPVPTAEPTTAPTAEPTVAPPVEPTPVLAPTADPSLALAPTPDPALDPALALEPALVVPEPTPAPDFDVAAQPPQLAFVPVADTSVMAVAPDAVQAQEHVGMLATGGSVGAAAYLTFEVAGVPAGGVLDAQLVLTGVGDAAGPGGVLGVLPGAWVDEAATYATAPPSAGPALTAAGTVATVDWLQPGVETVVDVSGSVAADGLVTFVVVGSPEAMAAIASRESGAPPRLVVTVAGAG